MAQKEFYYFHSTSNRASAKQRKKKLIWENSVRSVLRNFRLAGVLKNKSLTSMVVPSGCEAN